MSFYIDGRIGNGGWNPTFIKAIGLLFSEDENSGQELRRLYEEAVAANKATGTSKVVKKSESSHKSKYSGDVERKKNKGSSSKADLTKDTDQVKKEGKHDSFSGNSETGSSGGKRGEASAGSSSSSSGDKKRPKYTDIDMFASLSSSNKSSASKKMKKSSSSKSLSTAASSASLSSLSAGGESKPGAATSLSGDDGDGGGKMDVESDSDDVIIEETITRNDTESATMDTSSYTSNCVTCGESTSSCSGNGGSNQLLECNECHSYYHQKCHKPVVTDNEVSDPRHVWYCHKCSSKMPAAASVSTHSKGSSISKSQSSGSLHKLSSSAATTGGLFSMGSSSTAGKSPSSPGSTSSSKAGGGSGSALSQAERRVQEMKRRAASNKQDKRRMPPM